MATKTLKELSKETSSYLNFYQGTSEFDKSINDISREKIKAMKKEHGICFVGKFNLYGDERKKDYKLTEYTGQKIYNFEYTFCIPCHDSQIEKLITERDRAEYTGSRDDFKRIDMIMDRIEELGGLNLFWS